MRKILIWTFMLIMMLLFVGCGDKSPSIGKENGKVANTGTSLGTTKAIELILPDSYPKDVLPLAADAEIIDVRENPASNGLEVIYVSDNDVDTLHDFHERALKDAQNLRTYEIADGYRISATMDGVGYEIWFSKDAMNPNPQYAGKTSVYIILSGLKGVSGVGAEIAVGKGQTWPTVDLPGVPELNGHIYKILREDGVIWLEIGVDNANVIKNYIGELTAAGFSFDAQPDVESDHVQLFAFRDNNILNFAYDAEENYVHIEYHK